MRPVCLKCRTTMRCKKNEVELVIARGAIRSGDMYECPGCEFQVVVGFGTPWKKRYDEGFAEAAAKIDERFHIGDN